MDLDKLATSIIEGKRLNRGDDLNFFKDCNLDELVKAADRICAYFHGNKVDLCSIVSAKSGGCSEDCKFCAQSLHNKSDCKEYPFIKEEDILAQAKANAREGINRFAIVISGRAATSEEFDKATKAFAAISKDVKINLCASMGFLTKEQLKGLKEVGVTRYHHNIETSKRNFLNVCSTHTYEMKIATIKMAQEVGLSVCSGGIIGMGESFEDRIDMALSLSELKITSIPINALMAISGTPYENIAPLTESEILRTIAMFCFINPEATIRLAAGRKLLSQNGKLAFTSGASAAITGDMLTTCGSTIEADKAMLKELGRDNFISN